VQLRLRGRDPSFVVTAPPGLTTEEAPAEPDDDLLIAEDGPAARITVRLPEQLKIAIEQAAAKEGRSVNAWLTGRPPPACSARSATSARSHPAAVSGPSSASPAGCADRTARVPPSTPPTCGDGTPTQKRQPGEQEPDHPPGRAR